jgi:hypothetical protein
LDRVLADVPRPRSITVDHGTEFQSRALEDWAYRRGVQLDDPVIAGPKFPGREYHEIAAVADRGLDLNQRPLGYEPISNRDWSQRATNNAS